MKVSLVVALALCLVTPAPALAARAPKGQSSQQTQDQKQPARPSPAASPAPAASPQKKSTAAKPTPEPAFTDPQKLDAVNLLVKEIGRAKLYRRPSHAARVLVEATDVVWDYRDSIAEKGLRDAWALTDRELDDEGKIKGSERDAFSLHQLRTELRSDILAVAERHKPELVKVFAETIEEKGEDATASHNDPIVFGTGSLRQQQLAQFALRLAATEPARAVEYASASLDYGMPQELQGIFKTLTASSPALAHDLFARSVRAFAADQSPNLYDAIFVASYLRNLPSPEGDVALVRSFLDAALARLARQRNQQLAAANSEQGVRSAMLFALNYLQPFFQTYYPERANELVMLSQQLRPEIPSAEYEADALNLTSADNPNAPENILSRAASEKNDDTRDALYMQAALRYANLKKFERAFETLLRARVTTKRDDIMTSLRFQHAKYLAETNELNDAAKALEKIPDPEMRAEATVAVATAARRKKDLILARYVLDQTVKLIGDRPGSAPHARAYLWIASAYATVDPPTAFEMMWAAVKAANAAPTLVELFPARRFMVLGGTVREGFSKRSRRLPRPRARTSSRRRGGRRTVPGSSAGA
ncbi:MAG: hypothetical protein LC785_00460 [Acidobacteria bacterium]|nr:hypothetical protein [Acidobacteriota bacterium]